MDQAHFPAITCKPNFDNCFDTADNVFDNVDPTVDDGVSFSVEANMNNKGDIINQSVTRSQLTYNSLPLNGVGCRGIGIFCKGF